VAWAGKYDDLRETTVRVEVGDGCGTGVLVTRTTETGDTRTFVWTAGHVAQCLRDSDGFKNPKIYREFRENGHIIGTAVIEARVVAYSDPEYGIDVALLEVLQDNWLPVGGAKFYLDEAIPEVGEPLVHVGCVLGLYDATSEGIVSQTDVVLEDVPSGNKFDQTTVMGYPGSSGGGVYLQSTHECIGLLTRGSGPGINFIVPMRLISEWANKMGVSWAIDPDVDMPSLEERISLPLEDGTSPENIFDGDDEDNGSEEPATGFDEEVIPYIRQLA
jgi:hypothetical protein